MTMLQLLEYVDDHQVFPPDVPTELKHRALEAGYIYAEDTEVWLSSLGELEAGYPETNNEGDVCLAP